MSIQCMAIYYKCDTSAHGTSDYSSMGYNIILLKHQRPVLSTECRNPVRTMVKEVY